MATYLVLNCIFMLLTIVVMRLRLVRLSMSILIALGVLLVLTAIFDNLIIIFSIVDYDKTTLLGWYIHKAPVEDFFYAFFAILLIPYLWKLYGERHVK